MGQCPTEGMPSSPNFSDQDASTREAISENERTSIAYQNLTVYGFDARASHQRTFVNLPFTVIRRFARRILATSQDSRTCILQGFEGLVLDGEMLLVLGKPGSGCTTLLRVLAGDTHGLEIDPAAILNYQGKATPLTWTMDFAECSTMQGDRWQISRKIPAEITHILPNLIFTLPI